MVGVGAGLVALGPERSEYMAAVTAAPVPALTAAITAMVDLDMAGLDASLAVCVFIGK